MKHIYIIISFFLLGSGVYGQTSTSSVYIYKLFSENGEYILHSIPYDNEAQSILGKTYVFKVGQSTPLYTVNRHFNYNGFPNKINLSNDGQTILYINDDYGNDRIEERKSITVYNQGKLIKSYSLADINDCDSNIKDCYLLYRNVEVINRDSTKWQSPLVILGFNAGTSEAERFANTSNVFSHNDTTYLINQAKQLIRFDLKTGDLLNTSNFESSYSWLQSISRTNEIEIETINNVLYLDFPLLINGETVQNVLAKHLGMAPLDIYGKKSSQYKSYTVVVNAIIDTAGKLEINELKVDDGLDEQKTRDFLTAQTYDMTRIPKNLEKWRFNDYLYFRNKSKSKAKKEKIQEQIEEEKAYKERLTQEKINGVYIPTNLGDCFVQLDSMLKQKDKETMKALPNRTDMLEYHLGFGRTLRNSWGLWGGSRLQKYFLERGVSHPEDMSGVILEYYHDWLNGKTETWKDWEKENKIKTE